MVEGGSPNIVIRSRARTHTAERRPGAARARRRGTLPRVADDRHTGESTTTSCSTLACRARGRPDRSERVSAADRRSICSVAWADGVPVSRLGGWGVPVAESALAPPGPIPNPVVTQRSAGEYCGGDPTGGEAAADAPQPPEHRGHRASQADVTPSATRGGAAAARWAHNPKVGGSNPPPATRQRRSD